jgi:hypothetical protein
MMSYRMRGGLLIAAVFFCGALAGYAFSRSRPQSVVRVRVVRGAGMLFSQLGLDSAQQRVVDSIMLATQPRIDTIMDSSVPRLRSELAALDSAIRRVLTPTQMARYDSLLAIRAGEAR